MSQSHPAAQGTRVLFPAYAKLISSGLVCIGVINGVRIGTEHGPEASDITPSSAFRSSLQDVG